MRLRKEHILVIFAAAIVIYLVANGIYNYMLSEEQKVKNLFYDMASDIESRDVLGFGDYFTRDAVIRYHEFELSRREIGVFMFKQVQMQKSLKITFSELSVELREDEAVVTFVGDAIDVSARTRGSFQGTVKLRKEDGEWKIYDATGREHKRPKLIY
jgi:hypothetical protein